MFKTRLTDAEVKRALECCRSNNNAMCSMCPMHKVTIMPLCFSELSSYALHIINQYEVKIQRLEKQVSKIQNVNLTDSERTIRNYEEENKTLKTEIERLKKEVKEEQLYNLRMTAHSIKTEAYKECIEKVKKLWGNHSGYDFEKKLDKLLKEFENKKGNITYDD